MTHLGGLDSGACRPRPCHPRVPPTAAAERGMLGRVTVVVAKRADLTLDALRRVAWEREGVELAPAVAERMERGHAAFTRYVRARVAEDPGALLYGVTTGPGDAGGALLTEEAHASRPRGLWTASSFGEPLPERVVRAIVFARLANFVEGHTGARPAVAAAVAAMLDGSAAPRRARARATAARARSSRSAICSASWPSGSSSSPRSRWRCSTGRPAPRR